MVEGESALARAAAEATATHAAEQDSRALHLVRREVGSIEGPARPPPRMEVGERWLRGQVHRHDDARHTSGNLVVDNSFIIFANDVDSEFLWEQ